MSSTSTLTLRPVASTWSSPPDPMSYAQPSPPTIHTLRRTRLVHHAEQVSGHGGIEAVEAVFELGHPLALGRQLRLPQLRRRQNLVDELRRRRVSRNSARRRRASPTCASLANRRPSPNSALSSNSEFDQAGPRPSALVVQGVVGRLPP